MDVEARGPMTADQRALAADPGHLRLAGAIARRFGRRYPVLADEYESESLVALCGAARSFDGGYGCPFAAYATLAIGRAMVDLGRSWRPRPFRQDAAEMPRTASIFAAADDIDKDPDDLADVALTIALTLPAREGPVGWEAEYQDEVAGYCRRVPVRYQAPMAGAFAAAGSRRIGRLGAAFRMLGERFGSRADVFMVGSNLRLPAGVEFRPEDRVRVPAYNPRAHLTPLQAERLRLDRCRCKLRKRIGRSTDEARTARLREMEADYAARIAAVDEERARLKEATGRNRTP